MMTRLELALAHQGALRYIHTNEMACNPSDLVGMLNPSTPQGYALLWTVARNVGRKITDRDAAQIAAYLTPRRCPRCDQAKLRLTGDGWATCPQCDLDVDLR